MALRVGHRAKRGNHVEIFFAGQIRIEIGLLRNVAEVAAVSAQIFVNVFEFVEDLAASWVRGDR